MLLLVVSPISALRAIESTEFRTELLDSFYKLALARHKNSSASQRQTSPLLTLQLLRVPKAGSTSMSVLARRLAGCNPPGPCCAYPGTPPGSCPSKDLFKCDPQQGGPVIGCTHHKSDYKTLLNASIPSISMMRDPFSRSLSALFYPGIHHNSNCHRSQSACFLAYTRDNRFRNVAVKMFSGCYAYAPEPTCMKKRDCRCSLEGALESVEDPTRLAFVGLSELWEVSLLLFYHRFPSLDPRKEEFRLQNVRRSSAMPTQTSHKSRGSRGGRAPREEQLLNYHEFKEMVGSEPSFQEALGRQNALDIQLYQRVVQRFETELLQAGLLEVGLVSEAVQQFKDKRGAHVA
jgi:hypothetical protein